MNIHDVLHRAGPYLAVAGALIAVEGVLYNCFAFLPLGLHMLTMVTMGAHLSTAAAHLPFLSIGALIGTIIGNWTNDAPTAHTVRTTKSWIWIVASIAVLAIFIGTALQIYYSVAWGIAVLVFFGTIFYGLRLMAEYDAITRRIVLSLVGTTIILCWSGTNHGLLALEGEQPDVTISTDGINRKSGTMIGVYDRGSLFLLKPTNKLLFVSQRTNLVVEDVRDRFPDHSWRDAIAAWLKRKLGTGN